MHTLVIGLGSMGYGAALSCHRAGLETSGMDLNPVARDAFAADGGRAIADINNAGTVDCALIFVINADQAEQVIFESGLLSKLSQKAVIVNCVTLAPSRAIAIAERVTQAGFGYIDAPVSGGAAKARTGRMSIMASGHPDHFDYVKPVFDAISEHVFRLGDSPGAGSQMKLINQLLAGVHIAAAAEALNLAAGLKMDLHEVLEVISRCAGSSWMFENRGPHIADGDYTPLSNVNIFVKDLGIVTEEAHQSGIVTPLSEMALNLYRDAVSQGLGGEDDSAIAKVLAARSGVTLPRVAS
jgi:L-threonate 2-dehydrogenase